VRSTLLEGTVRHRRFRPFTYTLEHGVFYAALDLAELDAVDRRHRLLSRNRPNLLSFRDADHWPEPARDLRATMLAHLRAEGEDPTDWRITLITNLRVFGYVFNPASFYLCRDASSVLRIVVVEVHNTHGERHLYTLRPQADGAQFAASMDKDFYVSPFIEMSGGYSVRVADEPDGVRIAIVQEDGGQPLLAATLVLARRRMTDRMLARMLVRYPLVTLKTIVMIHWHAFHLWRRGARFHRHSEATR
jgi:uncharacterized protein